MSTYLLEALKAVRDKSRDETAGICLNAQIRLRKHTDGTLRQAHMEEACSSMQSLMCRWPESKDLTGRYPIEGSEPEYAQAMRRKTLWRNPRRIALLEWMIKELENDATGHPARN